ncbi:MAG: NTP transferase domain-containing protein [Geobacter sp.]|nr:NTP transferase domain-containing protein [Geobacter sp.]
MNRYADITAVVLAGGLGTRLRDAVADRPKVLAEVNDRPFITYLLDQLADAEVHRVVLCTGYMAEQVSATLGGSYRGMELLYSPENSPLGTGGALRLALPLIGSDPLLVMNGDSYCQSDLARLLDAHRAGQAAASLVLARVEDVGRYGAVDVSTAGVITHFSEKGSRQGHGLINAGIYLINRAVIEAITGNEAVSLEREIFPALISRHDLQGVVTRGRFIDIGIPSDYFAASAFFNELPGTLCNRGET